MVQWVELIGQSLRNHLHRGRFVMKPMQMIGRFAIASVVVLGLAIAPVLAVNLTNDFESQTEGVGGSTSVTVGNITYNNLVPAPGTFEFDYADVPTHVPVGMYLALGFVVSGDQYAVTAMQSMELSLSDAPLNTTGAIDSVTINVYELGNLSAGATVLLEALKGGSVIETDQYESVASGDPANPMVHHTITVSSEFDAFTVGALSASADLFCILDDITVNYIIDGDVNKDNIVNAPDLTALLAGYGSGTMRCDGDLNLDGVVNAPDLTNLLANYGNSATEGVPVDTPEPGTLALLGVLGVIGGLRRRHA